MAVHLSKAKGQGSVNVEAAIALQAFEEDAPFYQISYPQLVT